MNRITYLTGDATAPQIAGPKIIVHICNDIGGWGAGFVLAISKRWKEPEAAYRQWYADRDHNDFALGAVQLVSVESELWIANMIGQRGIRRSSTGRPPIRYDAVESCLEKVAQFAVKENSSIHMPRIGCGLAGGKWELIEPIIIKTCPSTDTYVYDFA